MSWAIFAQTDGVVGINHHLALLHQRGHTHRVTGIFNEHQEGGGVRQETTVQRDTVGNPRHTEFTYTVMDVVTGQIFVDSFRTRPDRQVRWCQIGGAAEEFRQKVAEGFDSVLGGFTAGNFCRVSLQVLDELLRFSSKLSRHFAFHAAGKFCGFLRESFSVGCELLVPCRFFRLACFFRIPLSVDL